MGADANRVELRYAQESSWGATPATPATTALRITSEGLEHRKATVTSNEIRSDGQQTAVLEVGQAADGPVNWELSWSDFEPFFRNALRNSLSSATVAASAVITASTITDSDANFVAAFQAGQFVRFLSSGHGDSGAVIRVDSVASTVLSYSASALSAATASANLTGRTLVNGNTKTSYFIEVDNEDITAVKYFTGMRVDGFAMNVASQQIVTGTFNLQGKRGFYASTTVASAVVTSAGTNTPMTAAANVGDIFENDVALSTAIQSITINVGRNMRPRPQIGQKPSAEHGDGSVGVGGNLTAYFEDISVWKKMVDHTESALAVRFNDDNNNTVVVSMPSVYFAAGNPTTPGLNQDVFLPLDFIARRDPTQGVTVRMDFLPVS